jgi:hypothetical protein
MLLAGSAAAQTADDRAGLAAFQTKTANYLQNLPNYTCKQRIQSFRGSGKGPLLLIEHHEREVAVVYGREMYLQGKDGAFAAPDAAPRVGSELTSSGEFAGHLHSLFLYRTMILDPTSQKATRVGRRRALRYDFRLPYNLSQWAIEVGTKREILAGKGVLWFDQKSLDLLRLRLMADEGIPPSLPIRSIEMEINLVRKRIGASDTLLPAVASVQLHFFNGEVQKNQIEFRGCKEFGTESTIRYDQGNSAEASQQPVPSLPQ